ncbi:hypothetical protein JGU66_12590 [Myxococcaceae bacterium JPH2]|nr:hypothetical protein [Myxococcaceae bacterium JPH2]
MRVVVFLGLGAVGFLLVRGTVYGLFGASADALAGEGESLATMFASAEGGLNAPAAPREAALEESESDDVKTDHFFTAPPAQAQKEMKKGSRGGGSFGLGGAAAEPKPASAPAPMVEADVGGVAPEPAESAAPTRAWFPETFLFEPLVVTDASGSATVPVRVPDRLTQWRVLALAHSRSGAQAGAVTSFAGTLPTYVDPVLPPFLRVGDAIRMPVQVVNTTDAAVERSLKVEATNAGVEGGAKTVRVPAHGSVVEYVALRASSVGPVTVRAVLGGEDAVVRDFSSWPTGRPVVETRGGSLAAPRTLTLSGPADAQAGSERVRLLVYPGALGVVRSELAAVDARGGGVEQDAYALLLSAQAPALLKALGETPDANALKALTAVAGQRVLRAARAPDVATAVLLAEGALSHPESAVLARLGERLVGQVAAAQRPDGTCQGGEGWTLQRLLVATSECARMVRLAPDTADWRRRGPTFALRAVGAFERNLSLVRDGYTAAALLTSGVVSGSLADALRQRVREAVRTRADGTAYLPVEPGVVRADNVAPSEVESTALAVLALMGDAKAPLADLGATLLAGYAPGRGWGDGRANLVGLRAALALFREPVPSQVRVVLERDGQVVSEGTHDAKALRDVLAVEAAAPGSAGAHTWTVRAEPAVSGLGFSLSLAATVPWKAEAQGGLQLAVKAPTEAKVGQPVELSLQAAAPSGVALELRQGLPAGVQVDPVGLDTLVREGHVTSWHAEDGAVTLVLPPRGVGEPFQARLRVVPTLAGTLQGGAATLSVLGRPDLVSRVPPTTWAVR